MCLRAQELGLTCNLPSLGQLVLAFFAVLGETLQAGHRQVKRRRKLFGGPPGTCKLLGWAPACSVLLGWSLVLLDFCLLTPYFFSVQFYTFSGQCFSSWIFKLLTACILAIIASFCPCSYLKWLFVLCQGFFLQLTIFSQKSEPKRCGCAISELGLVSQRAELPGADILGLRLQKLEWVQKRIIRLKKQWKYFPARENENHLDV